MVSLQQRQEIVEVKETVWKQSHKFLRMRLLKSQQRALAVRF